MTETLKSSRFKIYSWGLFLFVLIYLLLRAWFVEPLHDESATYLHYIELEKIYGEGVILDANNHLLNSYLGSWMHHFFGSRFFFVRLPNVLCFALYFWGCYRLVKSINLLYFKVILLTAMVTVAYMDDYFAYTRGYGMAISFFIWMLVYAHKWMQENSVKNAGLLYFFTLMAIFSNLIFLVSGCLAMALVGIVHLQQIRKWDLKKQLSMFALHFLFLLGMMPFVYISYVLKLGGALYYGSLDGFWEVTGKTLTRYVLFYDADWQKWLLLALILAFAALLTFLFRTKGFWNQLKEEPGVFGWFFFGNMAAVLILAKFMDVNYPEDRAGMYFIPLSILIFGFSIVKLKLTQPLVLLLLFFPLSFAMKMNLTTSVFTPDERINAKLFEAVKKELIPESTLSIYHTMGLNWSMHERGSGWKTKFQPNINNNLLPFYDVIVNKESQLLSMNHADYDLIYADKPSGISAYQRKKPLKRSLLTSYSVPDLVSADEYLNLLGMNFPDTLRGSNMVLKISGGLKINEIYRDVKIVVSTFNSKNEQIRYTYYDQRWVNGLENLDFSININHVFEKLMPEETELRLYIWNPQHSNISFKNGEIHFYKLIE